MTKIGGSGSGSITRVVRGMDPQHYIYHWSDHHADGPAAEAGEPGPTADAVPRAGHLLPPRDGGVRGRLRHCRDPQHRGQHPQLLQATQPPGQPDFSTLKIAKRGTCTWEGLFQQ
jgi:hypothetical protein